MERAEDLARQAMLLMNGGDLESALAAGERALELYRPLAEMDLARHGPGMAAVLQFQGVRNSMLDRKEQALPYCREALALRRKLAAEHPRVCGPVELAAGLNDASVLLSALGHLDEATTLSEEAVAMYRAADAGPDLLTMGLANLALRLSATGRHEEAKLACAEAVAATQRTSPSPDGAMRLAGVRGKVFAAAGDEAEAHEAICNGLKEALPALRNNSGELGYVARMLLADLDRLGGAEGADWLAEINELVSSPA